MRKRDYLNTPLLDLGGGIEASFCDLTRNILVIGTMSSGKSSGPGGRTVPPTAEKRGLNPSQPAKRDQTQEPGTER